MQFGPPACFQSDTWFPDIGSSAQTVRQTKGAANRQMHDATGKCGYAQRRPSRNRQICDHFAMRRLILQVKTVVGGGRDVAY